MEEQWREVQVIPLVSSTEIHSVFNQTEIGSITQHSGHVYERRCQKDRIIFLNYGCLDTDIVNFCWLLCWRYHTSICCLPWKGGITTIPLKRIFIGITTFLFKRIYITSLFPFDLSPFFSSSIFCTSTMFIKIHLSCKDQKMSWPNW